MAILKKRSEVGKPPAAKAEVPAKPDEDVERAAIVGEPSMTSGEVIAAADASLDAVATSASLVAEMKASAATRVAAITDEARAAYDRKANAAEAVDAMFTKPRSLRSPEVSADFAAVQEHIFRSRDIHADYLRLERELALGAQRTDHGSLTKALDDAEANARLAHGLYSLACVERKRWELDAVVVEGGMRTSAVEALQEEKKQGERSKAITEADVELKCASMFPDEWRDVQMKREKAKRMVDSLEHLAATWKDRAKDLNTLLHVERR